MERRPLAARNRRTRDAGLRRVAKLTRWSLAGALTGTGVFAGLAAQVGRGAGAATKPTTKTPVASSATRSPSTRGVRSESDESESEGDSNVPGTSALSSGSNAPATAPATTPATQPPYVAPVTSGGSVSVVSGAS